MTDTVITAGIDAGTACVKAILLKNGVPCGRGTVPANGYFQDRALEALAQALDEAQLEASDIRLTCATGYAAECVQAASTSYPTTACLALGARYHQKGPMTLIDIGGQDAKMVLLDADGVRVSCRNQRKCAAGMGLFLDTAARRLNVHPTRLQSLAGNATGSTAIGSYCSVFADSEILERVREGATLENVAFGCIESVAERVCEIGEFPRPVWVAGGVITYFPALLRSIAQRVETPVKAFPEPIMVTALGAAWRAHEMVLAEASMLENASV